jgi:four helix bundle protein
VSGKQNKSAVTGITAGLVRQGQELVQFLYRARGSLLELETQLSIAHELGYLDTSAFKRLEELMGEEGRILNGLINRFEDKIARCA